MSRMLLSVGLCLAALGLGFFTACRAAKNRARAAELDAEERWCETFSRQNELLANEVLAREWRLLDELQGEHGPQPPPAEVEQ